MAEAIVYCEQCGHMVPPSQRDGGKALVSGNIAFCESCAETLDPAQRAAFAKKARPSSRRLDGKGRSTPTASQRIDSGESGAQNLPTWIKVAIFAPGVLLGVIIVLLLRSGASEPPQVSSAFPALPPTVPVEVAKPPTVVTSSAPQTTAAVVEHAPTRLGKIRKMIDPALGKYEEIRTELAAIAKENPEGPEAKQAAEMLREVDEKYAAIADAALEEALAAAREMLAKGEPEAAASVLFSIRGRFGYSAWYRDRGKARIAEAMEPIEKAIERGGDAPKPLAGQPATETTGPDPMPAGVGEGYVPGLLGEYFDGVDRDPHRLVTRRVDSKIEFSWGEGIPVEGVKDDRFSVRWSGELMVPAAGEYTFEATCDDMASLTIGRAPSITGKHTLKGTMRLDAGWTPIRVEYLDLMGGAGIVLSWSGPALPKATIGRAHCRTSANWKTQPVAPLAADTPGGVQTASIPGETGKPGQWAPGLVFEMFDSLLMEKRTAVRVDNFVANHYGACGPDLDSKVDSFLIRWTGWLLVPADGEYMFYGEADDFLTATVDGTLVLDRSHDKDENPTVEYEAGLHPLRVIFGENGGRASAVLSWSGPGFTRRVVPPDHLFHGIPESGSAGPAAKLVHGLRVEYYKGMHFERKVASGEAARVDFDLGDGPPVTGCPSDDFSIRMEGRFLALAAGEHSFNLESDGKARLSIDGKAVVEKADGGRSSIGRTNLTSGYHALALDYSHARGRAWLRLLYDEPQGKADEYREVSPHLVFREASDSPLVDRQGLAPGLLGSVYSGIRPGAGKPVLKRIDPVIAFNSANRPLGSGVDPAPISAVWKGSILVPTKGIYEFHVKRRGGVRLQIGSRTVIDKWSAAADPVSARVSLRAGSSPMTLAYFNEEGTSELEVYWSGPDFHMQMLGGEALAHKAARLPVAEAAGPRGTDPSPRSAVAGKTVGRNLVVNGGFEEPGDDATSARMWTGHQWGEANRRFSARTDRSLQHSGEKALVVRGLQEGAAPGAFTGLSLPPGSYEVSFWACCEVDKKASVRAHLAGTDLPAKTIGEEWEKLTGTVTIVDRQPRVSLKLWTTTAMVRVWFDDVEVRAVQ